MSIKTIALPGQILYNVINRREFRRGVGILNLKTRTKSNLLLILAVAAVLAVVSVPFLFAQLNAKRAHAPVAQNGISDFSNALTNEKIPFYLKGEWTEYPGKWIISDSLEKNSLRSNPYTLPVNFFSSFEDIDTPLGDKSSYVLKIRNLDMQNAVIYIPHFAGSYRIFINGYIVSQSGEYTDVGSKANLSADTALLNFSKDSDYEIVIELSCNYMPGLYMTPAIANAEYASSRTSSASTLRSIIFGAVAFCTALFFAYSITKRKIFHSKWLPVLFLVIMLRLAISTEGFSSFSFIFSKLDYEQLTLLICSSTFIVKLVSLLFYTETLDIKLKKSLSAVFCVLFLLFTALYCAVPKTVYTPFYNIIVQFATLPLDIILLGYLTNSIARKVPYAFFYTVGYTAILSGLLIDCYYTNGLISYNSSSYLPVLFAFFVVSFSAVFIKQITQIYNAALKAAELDKQLSEANMAIMVSQIQPHFLYNALNTIKYLIKRDPQTAEKAIVSFSYYLRRNMDSLTEKAPIPFTDEIAHVKHYSDIEMLRFGDRVNVEYDIKCDCFSIPALTIQPIVENAIKHGITKNPDGGTVKISSFEDEDFFFVKVDDDGIGFDIDNPDCTDNINHAHIGLSNVAGRLKSISNADFEIRSREGDGTHVTIKIPKFKT